MDEETARREIVRIAQKLAAGDLVRLSAGNVSVRTNDGLIAITPTGIRYEKMQPSDIVTIDLHGKIVRGTRKPSSEVPMHTMVLREMPDVGAVVHTHSPYATAFACTGVELPAICVELLGVGAPVPVAPFACPGTNRPGELLVKALKNRPGLKCLILRNHGVVSIGPDLEAAYANAVNLEQGARVYLLALQTGHAPIELTEREIEEVRQVYPRL